MYGQALWPVGLLFSGWLDGSCCCSNRAASAGSFVLTHTHTHTLNDSKCVLEKKEVLCLVKMEVGDGLLGVG